VKTLTLASPRSLKRRHSFLLFRLAWYSVNFLLVAAVIFTVCSAAWEYSTGRYLRGFADAIIPSSASGETKIEAILHWFSFGPARQDADATSLLPERDPTQTLNYAKLLHACGTATNAFINLADSGGLKARRLLLLDSHRLTKHVVAEVLIDGRWIVVDPAFQRILRGLDGMPLTREELAEPAVWSAATRDIPGYDPSYTYDVTAHVRLARLTWIGSPLRTMLNRLAPTWEDSWTLSLLLERESLAVLVGSIAFALLVYAMRSLLRRYGEKRLNIRTIRLTDQVRRAVVLSFSRPPESQTNNAAQPIRSSHVAPQKPESAPTSTTVGSLPR
jgi:hypothetical protein